MKLLFIEISNPPKIAAAGAINSGLALGLRTPLSVALLRSSAMSTFDFVMFVQAAMHDAVANELHQGVRLMRRRKA